MPFKINSITGNLDLVTKPTAPCDKLLPDDGTVEPPKKEIDGYDSVAKISSEGRIYFYVEGKKYYVKGTLVAGVPPGWGNPYGLLLSLTVPTPNG